VAWVVLVLDACLFEVDVGCRPFSCLFCLFWSLCPIWV